MDPKNETTKPASNMEKLKQEAAGCGSDCACHAADGSARVRWIVGTIVLLAAGALVVRAVMKDDQRAAPPKTANTFAIPMAAATPADSATPADPAAVVVKEIAGFAELNTLATDTTAVFVFLPAKAGEAGVMPTAQMESTAKTLAAKGTKVGLFSLKADSADYKNVTSQTAAPAVLVMVKGRGMVPVSGEITEAKLIQGVVAASSAGGCGAGGCGSGGC